ncbi:hypothetical protein NBRC116590_04730 [Pelagimonas sp. KU-00592-HH]|uniref:hypothetical protein n=1 Tax=Pelagimonas sp. KU-00592-HH TaxID=3127651 RepID=UPI00310A4FF8
MHLNAFISPVLPALALGVTACAPVDGNGVTRNGGVADLDYIGVETRLLEDDLVNFRAALSGSETGEDVRAYAECAAAQYALIRGFGFARHLRTNVEIENGIWRGDAVYVISASLPRGLKTIDAEVIVSNCEENGIPTV